MSLMQLLAAFSTKMYTCAKRKQHWFASLYVLALVKEGEWMQTASLRLEVESQCPRGCQVGVLTLRAEDSGSLSLKVSKGNTTERTDSPPHGSLSKSRWSQVPSLQRAQSPESTRPGARAQGV